MKYSVSTSKPEPVKTPTGYKSLSNGNVYWKDCQDTWRFFSPRAGEAGVAYPNNNYNDKTVYQPVYDDIVITISKE